VLASVFFKEICNYLSDHAVISACSSIWTPVRLWHFALSGLVGYRRRPNTLTCVSGYELFSLKKKVLMNYNQCMAQLANWCHKPDDFWLSFLHSSVYSALVGFPLVFKQFENAKQPLQFSFIMIRCALHLIWFHVVADAVMPQSTSQGKLQWLTTNDLNSDYGTNWLELF